MIIAAATIQDAEAILHLQRLAYQREATLYQDWSIPPLTESLQQLLAEFGQQCFLKACSAHSPALVGSVRARLLDDTCSIGRLIVHPEFQRKGVGSALMQQVEQTFSQAGRFELFTGHRSKQNLTFYQRLGYVPFREQQLSDHVTLIYLQKTVA